MSTAVIGRASFWLTCGRNSRYCMEMPITIRSQWRIATRGGCHIFVSNLQGKCCYRVYKNVRVIGKNRQKQARAVWTNKRNRDTRERKINAPIGRRLGNNRDRPTISVQQPISVLDEAAARKKEYRFSPGLQ